MPDNTEVVTLGLGGNLGDPKLAMALAIDAIHKHDHCQLLEVSNLYKTPPWGNLDQPDFYNCCVSLTTSLSAIDLLDLCLKIEKDMHRVRDVRWGPRTLDIDILTYGDETVDMERIEIPHPRMHQRGFVLMPLIDIAPDICVFGKAITDWVKCVDIDGIVKANNLKNWWKI